MTSETQSLGIGSCFAGLFFFFHSVRYIHNKSSSHTSRLYLDDWKQKGPVLRGQTKQKQKQKYKKTREKVIINGCVKKKNEMYKSWETGKVAASAAIEVRIFVLKRKRKKERDRRRVDIPDAASGPCLSYMPSQTGIYILMLYGQRELALRGAPSLFLNLNSHHKTKQNKKIKRVRKEERNRDIPSLYCNMNCPLLSA